MPTNARRAVGLAVAAAGLIATSTTPAAAHPRLSIDETVLVPTLSTTFSPWTCHRIRTDTACTGRRQLHQPAAELDINCDHPVFDSYNEDRRQTRFYDADNLLYASAFTNSSDDQLSSNAAGPATASVITETVFTERFAIRGDSSTVTITTTGLLWQVRTASGHTLYQVVGTLVEPYNSEPTFTGTVKDTKDTKHYRNTPLATFFSDDAFANTLCAATASARK